MTARLPRLLAKQKDVYTTRVWIRMNEPKKNGLMDAHGSTDSLGRALPQKISKTPGGAILQGTQERLVSQAGCGSVI